MTVANSQRLRTRRNRAGVSLETFAAEIGCTGGALSDIERGRRRPGLEVAVRIEAATEGTVRIEDWSSDPAERRALARAMARIVEQRASRRRPRSDASPCAVTPPANASPDSLAGTVPVETNTPSVALPAGNVGATEGGRSAA